MSGRKACYAAGIEGVQGQRLAKTEDFPSEDAAQAWCEATYTELLKAELVRVAALPGAAQG
jgi:hypothetical protein